MAAEQRDKKKARAMKKNKAKKKHQQTRKQQKLQARKLKKPHSRLACRVKRAPLATKAPSSDQICCPRRFASKILRQMPKVRMEAKARGMVKTLLTDLYDHVATEVETLSQKGSDLSTISCADVQNSLKDAMAKELAKHTNEPTGTTPTTSTTTITPSAAATAATDTTATTATASA